MFSEDARVATSSIRSNCSSHTASNATNHDTINNGSKVSIAMEWQQQEAAGSSNEGSGSRSSGRGVDLGEVDE